MHCPPVSIIAYCSPYAKKNEKNPHFPFIPSNAPGPPANCFFLRNPPLSPLCKGVSAPLGPLVLLPPQQAKDPPCRACAVLLLSLQPSTTSFVRVLLTHTRVDPFPAVNHYIPSTQNNSPSLAFPTAKTAVHPYRRAKPVQNYPARA